MLLKLLYALSANNSNPLSKDPAKVSIDDLLRLLSAGSDAVYSIGYDDHRLVIAQLLAGEYFLYDPNNGLARYVSPEILVDDLSRILEKLYEVELSDRSAPVFEMAGRVYIEEKFLSLSDALLDQRRVLLDLSVNEVILSFAQQYILPTDALDNDAQFSAIKAEHNLPLIDAREFYRHKNNSALELSTIVTNTIEALSAAGSLDQTSRLEIKQLAYEQFAPPLSAVC